jgi:hypothetical protein
MRVQIYIIVILLSFMAWIMSFDGARKAYREAHEAGVIPNMHIKHKIRTNLREIVAD